MLRLVSIILLLTACGCTDEQAGPGEVTVGEAKALDDAAAMLKERDEPNSSPTTAGDR